MGNPEQNNNLKSGIEKPEAKIEVATLNNLKDIQELNRMLFKKEHEEYDESLDCEWTFSPDGEGYFRERIEKDGGCAFVAHLDGKVVGYLVAGLMEVPSHRKLPPAAELENMFVLDECRGKGVGSKLFKAFKSWCDQKGVCKLRVVASAKNVEGINFYRKNGFEDYDVVLETDI